MKIYAITQGDYSDYHICALTISKEKAEKIKKLYTKNSGYEDAAMIEEYEDGEVEDIKFFWRYDSEDDEVEIDKYAECNEKERAYKYSNHDSYCAYVWSHDAEHARKKAQDMIAQYKAEKEEI